MPDDFAKGGQVFELYQKIYAFHKKHRHAATDAEWDACVRELSQFTTPFEVDLVVAVVKELERRNRKG